jgi:hypothetical protein
MRSKDVSNSISSVDSDPVCGYGVTDPVYARQTKDLQKNEVYGKLVMEFFLFAT